MSCDVGEVTERLENELCCVCVRALRILQPFRHFTYVTSHSPILPSLYLGHSLFSDPSVASPTSQFILQPFFRFSYVTNSSLNSPGEPPMLSVSRFLPFEVSSPAVVDIFRSGHCRGFQREDLLHRPLVMMSTAA